MPYAYYRLPYDSHYTKITSERDAAILSDYRAIGDAEGFVIAPFAVSKDTPIVLIHPDSITTVDIEEEKTAPAAHGTAAEGASDPDAQYSEAFETFHTAVADGTFSKLVLARCKDAGTTADAHELFLRLCHAYPRLMIQLFHTEQTGTWIVATPEILIEAHDDALHTIALAGTMPFSEGYAIWSEKNKAEQHIVEQYIERIIARVATQIVKDGPTTVRAGNLVHLRTDFRFTLAQGHTIGETLALLHPTPAVCGLPTDKAAAFISRHEGIARTYYSGFAGPVGISGATHLYVSLRCACISPASVLTLYAGGGIMPDSECRSEWYETENKMKTIAGVL